jgi:uncharacterized protein with ParB-like and HNH nuclease domain
MLIISVAEETIPNLMAKLERGDIQIPELQQAFVWKKSQVELLIDSIYREKIYCHLLYNLQLLLI